jgi:hypothetical protein
MMDRLATDAALAPAEDVDGREFDALLLARSERDTPEAGRIDGVLVGRLVGFTNDGDTPLVTYPGQSESAALPARTTVDLHASHIDRDVMLVFEAGDPRRPIVAGCLKLAGVAAMPGQVQIEADGRRTVVSAREQIVLRCGEASITLTAAGKILIQGAYVSAKSSGVLRVKGGSVQIN